MRHCALSLSVAFHNYCYITNPPIPTPLPHPSPPPPPPPPLYLASNIPPKRGTPAYNALRYQRHKAKRALTESNEKKDHNTAAYITLLAEDRRRAKVAEKSEKRRKHCYFYRRTALIFSLSPFPSPIPTTPFR